MNTLFLVLYREAPGDTWQVDSEYELYPEAHLRGRQLHAQNATWEIILVQQREQWEPMGDTADQQ